MYATNAKKRGWMDEVKLVFFGPSQKLLVNDKAVQEAVQGFNNLEDFVACKALADQEKISDQIAQLGVKVEYVGSLISNYMKTGYQTMVW
jgi:hypothetical protein